MLHFKPMKAAQGRKRAATQCFITANTRKRKAYETVYDAELVAKSQQHGGIKPQVWGPNETTEPKNPS